MEGTLVSSSNLAILGGSSITQRVGSHILWRREQERGARSCSYQQWTLDMVHVSVDAKQDDG